LKAIEKTPTGIKGFDEILFGGLPEGWTVLLSGSSGTGKTIFSVEYLYRGITEFNEPGVFVACEESSDKIKRAVAGFGWDLEALEKEGKLVFIDVANRWITDIGDTSTAYGLGTVIKEVENAVKKIGAKRVVVDPTSTLLLQFDLAVAVRGGLNKISKSLEALGCTSILTTEKPESLGMTTWKNVEDFVLDGIIVLYSRAEDGKRIREVEVEKMRGESFLTGRHPFRITNEGVGVFSMPKYEPSAASEERVSIGSESIDKMIGGGVFRGDCTLVAGPTGTGKTLLGVQFIKNGVENNEKGLIISFEESPGVLIRNAENIGFNLEKAEKDGLVKIIHPSTIDLIPEEFLSMVKEELNGADRVVIDSATSYSSAFKDPASYKDNLVTMLQLFKSRGITPIITSEMPELFGAFKITNSGTSFIVDNIIILKYVEVASEIRKAISVLKMRGSQHEKGIIEFHITSDGITIEEKFEALEGLLAGSARRIGKTTAEKLKDEFTRTLGPVGLDVFERFKESPKDIEGYIDSLVKDKIITKSEGKKFKERINVILKINQKAQGKENLNTLKN